MDEETMIYEKREAVKALCHMAHDELAGAKQYAEMAVAWKDKNASAATQFDKMANEEMVHAHKLIEQANTIVRDGGKGLENMMCVVEFTREADTKTTAKIASYHNTYNSKW